MDAWARYQYELEEFHLLWRIACKWEGREPLGTILTELDEGNPYIGALIAAYDRCDAAYERLRAERMGLR